MPTLTETLHEQCRTLITQRGMFTEDLLAALRLIAGRSDGMLSELLAQYGGLQYLLLNGLPFLNWNFAGASFPTTGLTFSRAGDRAGTVTDFEKIVWRTRANEMRMQGLRRVENLVPNSNSPQNATVNTFSPAPSTNSLAAPDGTITAWQILAGTTGFGQSNLTIPADSSAYVLSEYVKALAPGARVYLVANGINTVDTTAANTTSYYDFDTNSFGPGVGPATSQILEGGWVRISRKFQNNGTGTTFLVRTDAQPASAGRTAYWGFQLEVVPTALSTVSEYVSNGVLPSPFHGYFADGVKYFTTDRSGALISDATREGALLEEASTNIALRSEEFNDAVWQYQDTTVTADNTTSPDGSIDADLLTEGVAGTARCLQPVTITANTVNTWSLFLKRGNHDWVRVGVYDPTLANSFQGWINLATGALGASGVGGTGTLASFRVFDAGNGWYRVCISGNLGGAITTAWPLTISATADNSGTRVNNGTRYQWGAQFEQKSYETSYIPTSGTSVTRSADLCDLALGSWFFPDQGTWYVQGIRTAQISATILEGNGPAVTTRGISIATMNTGLGMRALQRQGAVLDDTSRVYGTSGSSIKVAVAWDGSTVAGYADGTQMASTATPPQADYSTSMAIGRRGLIGAYTGLAWNSTVKAIRYYPSRLPNTELAALTA